MPLSILRAILFAAFLLAFILVVTVIGDADSPYILALEAAAAALAAAAVTDRIERAEAAAAESS